jgi:hypothetical protein
MIQAWASHRSYRKNIQSALSERPPELAVLIGRVSAPLEKPRNAFTPAKPVFVAGLLMDDVERTLLRNR